MTEPKNRLTVMVTDDCNLSCVGCVTDAQDGKQGKRVIDTGFVEQVLTQYGDNFRDPMGRMYLFFSGRGEPTLRMDTIEEIHGIAKRDVGADKLHVGIQTNGVINEPTRKKVASLADIVWMSVDGAPQENDEIRHLGSGLRALGNNRGSSYYVSRNTRALIADGVEVRWRSTIHHATMEKQRELVDYAHSLGITTVVAEPVIRSPSKQGTGSIYLLPMERFIDRFLDANKYAARFGIAYTTGLMEEAKQSGDDSCGKRCGECFSIDPQKMIPSSVTLTTDNRMAGCYLGYVDNLRMHSLTFGMWDGEKIELDRIQLTQLSMQYAIGGGCHGRSLVGDALVAPALLERLGYEAVFPAEMRHP